MVFSGYSSFLHQYTWPPQYNWNIVESGIKHHKPTSFDLLDEPLIPSPICLLNMKFSCFLYKSCGVLNEVKLNLFFFDNLWWNLYLYVWCSGCFYNYLLGTWFTLFDLQHTYLWTNTWYCYKQSASNTIKTYISNQRVISLTICN